MVEYFMSFLHTHLNVPLFCYHAQSFMSGISCVRKNVSSSSGSSCCCKSGQGSSVVSSGVFLCIIVFANACAGVILSKAKIALLVAP